MVQDQKDDDISKMMSNLEEFLHLLKICFIKNIQIRGSPLSIGKLRVSELGVTNADPVKFFSWLEFDLGISTLSYNKNIYFVEFIR